MVELVAEAARAIGVRVDVDVATVDRVTDAVVEDAVALAGFVGSAADGGLTPTRLTDEEEDDDADDEVGVGRCMSSI